MTAAAEMATAPKTTQTPRARAARARSTSRLQSRRRGCTARALQRGKAPAHDEQLAAAVAPRAVVVAVVGAPALAHRTRVLVDPLARLGLADAVPADVADLGRARAAERAREALRHGLEFDGQDAHGSAGVVRVDVGAVLAPADEVADALWEAQSARRVLER